MNALPDSKLIDVEGHYLGTDDMMNILALNYVGPTFSLIGSFVFGALLLSAVNTAIIDLVAIQYMMGRDGEAPSILCKLNKHGVPGYALGVAMLIPSILLMIFSNLEDLAGLYSVGVVSAITINLFVLVSQSNLNYWGGKKLFFGGWICYGVHIAYLALEQTAGTGVFHGGAEYGVVCEVVHTFRQS